MEVEPTLVEEAFSVHMNYYVSLLSPSHTFVPPPPPPPSLPIHTFTALMGSMSLQGHLMGLCLCGRHSLAKSRAGKSTGMRQEYTLCKWYIIVVELNYALLHSKNCIADPQSVEGGARTFKELYC